jgi:uncharacterized RDD family membrane protein YckC
MPDTPTPGILRRLASMLYDGLLLMAVLFVAAFLFIGVTHDAQSPGLRFLFQVYLLAITAAYLIWFWLHGGQTLAMKTWRLRLISRQGSPVTLRQAALRFILAFLGLPLGGIGILWAFFDRDRQFLHDRLAGTEIVLRTED